MRFKNFLWIILFLIFYSCEYDSEENIYFEKLVDKEWVSQNGFDYIYSFSRNHEYTRVSKYHILNPITNEISQLSDTTKAYWKLNGNAVMFSSTESFPEDAEIQPIDWRIIEINNTTLKVKYHSDIDNPYILPWVYSAN